MYIYNEERLRKIAESDLQICGLQLSNVAANEKLLFEAKTFDKTKSYDVFLSHRTSDAWVAYGIKKLIERQQLSVFVYWVDNPSAKISPVTRKTADSLRSTLRACSSLVYVDTINAEHSKWMPWQLGYVDGLRQKVAIFPVAPRNQEIDEYEGQEYLGLYPWIRRGKGPGKGKYLSVVDRKKFISFLHKWVKDKN